MFENLFKNYPRFKEIREFEKYQLFIHLLKAEQESMHRFLVAEKEIQSMVNSLQQKDEDVVLEEAIFSVRQYTGGKNYNREPVGFFNQSMNQLDCQSVQSVNHSYH